MIKTILILAAFSGLGIGAYAYSTRSSAADDCAKHCTAVSQKVECISSSSNACAKDKSQCPTSVAANAVATNVVATNVVAAASSPAACAAIEECDETECAIALDALPKGMLDAATAKLAGFVATSAEKECEGGKVVYSITGAVNGKTWEIEVSEDGTILEVEEEDGDDEDDAK